MGLGNISRIWMPLIGILFCVVDAESENNLVFEADKIVSAGIEMPYRVACTNGIDNPALVIFSLDGRRLSESPCKGLYIERLIYNDGIVASFKILK